MPFGSAAIPYVVRSTIGLLSDSYASCPTNLRCTNENNAGCVTAQRYHCRREAALSSKIAYKNSLGSDRSDKPK